MRLKTRGAMNILDLHVHSENFYLGLFELVFGWNLENLNTQEQNASAIDLIDRTRRIIIQVSATATKQKINASLSKEALENYRGHAFKFMFIAEPNNNLREKKYLNPYNLDFDPKNDIYDYVAILKKINGLSIPKMEPISDFIRNELKIELDSIKVESNLATIIQSIHAEDWSSSTKTVTAPFEIENKITYNGLKRARELIEEYRIHYHRIEKIYSEYDRIGRNKSLSVLNRIKTEFCRLDDSLEPDELFFKTIDRIKVHVKASANHVSLPEEELDLCVGILVVDAFIRCKIFKNPID